MLKSTLSTILTGPLADSASGFILALPPGVTGIDTIKTALVEHYTTEAHPDLMIVTSEKTTIGVEAVRDLTAFLKSSPSTRMKTLWIPKAETLTEQAANAFLKNLEEPTSSTRIIMSTDNPAALLPTIRSRCQLYSAITDKALMANEMKAAGIEKSNMADAIKYGGGNVKAAIELDSVKGAMTWAKSLDGFFQGKKRPAMPKTGKDGLSALTCALVFQAAMARVIHQKKDEKLLKAADTWLAQNTDITRPGLDIKTRLLSWHHLFS